MTSVQDPQVSGHEAETEGAFDLPYPVFDFDSHLYEPREALETYLPEKYRRAVRYVDVKGRTQLAVNNYITDYIPNPTFEVVAAPGAHEQYYAGNNPEGLTLRELTGKPIRSIPAFREPEPRLAVMDKQHVDAALVLPTLANLVEQTAADDPELVHAVIHAINEWIYDVWSYDYKHRLYPAPVITLALVEDAIKELEYVLERGAKTILIRPAPVKGLHGWRSPGAREFDPFWKRVEEANLPVIVHAAMPPLNDYVAMWDDTGTSSAFEQTPFRMVTFAHRDIEDMVSALVLHGVCSRFPKIRFASIENGSDWIGPLLHRFELAYSQMPKQLEENPVEVFRRNWWINPFWEGNPEKLAELVDPSHIVFGSDYPHPEGLAAPLKYFDYLEGVPAEKIPAIMGQNAFDFMGVEPPAKN
ncbi:amidohydrolase [Nocardia nova]|uniref:Amidohydrolase n=1 Tax=Nocardia nova TaxID=37330 RepID=A0A2S6AVK8_9NOCA|nr:amidohydrolase family protein [Nocardia nova]PPJ33475.1 amidohydrolase [Nocardia nova]PPJ39266.1 amidohydrolase [Nocardia nova]